MFENYCNAFFCRAVFATHCSDFRVNIVILADFRFFSPLPCTNNERTTSNEFLALNKCLLALWHRAPCEHTTNMNTEIHEKQVTTEQLIQFNCSCLIPQVFFCGVNQLLFLQWRAADVAAVWPVVKVQHSHKIPKNFKI